MEFSVFSMDCFIVDTQSSSLPFWFIRSCLQFALPIVLILVYWIWLQFNSFFSRQQLNQKFKITTAVFIYLYFFPSLINIITKSVSCRTIGDLDYAQIDLTIPCGDYEEHQKFVYLFIIPFFVIFGIVGLFLLFYKLQAERTSKQSKFDCCQLKFIYDMYLPKYHYWELVKLALKSFIMFLSIYLSQKLVLKVRIHLMFRIWILHIELHIFVSFSFNLPGHLHQHDAGGILPDSHPNETLRESEAQHTRTSTNRSRLLHNQPLHAARVDRR